MLKASENPKRLALLRVCASCEWVFKLEHKKVSTKCPLCESDSRGARQVYGENAQWYLRTQKPWMEKKVDTYRTKLEKFCKKEISSPKAGVNYDTNGKNTWALR